MSAPATYDVGGVMLPRPFKLRRFGHLGYTNQDNQAALDFYNDNLGFRSTDAAGMPGLPPAVFFSTYGADHHALVHVDAKVAGNDPAYATGVTTNQISFQVGSLKEVHDAYRYMIDHGVPMSGVGRDFPGSNWAVYFRAPEGWMIELFYGMEQIGWQRESKPVELYSSGPIFANPHNPPPLPQRSDWGEVRETEAKGPLGRGFRPATDANPTHDVGGVSLDRPFAIGKIGPVVMFVEDVAASEDFYVRHLGFVRSEATLWQGHESVFLRNGAEHHTIGLVSLAAREALGFDPRTRICAFGVEVGSYRQLRDARDWLRGRGIEILDDVPGELHPGIDYAFHFRDPHGHTVMVYYYMEQVGWDGRVRTPAERRPVETPWPETLAPMTDTYMDQVMQGPIG